MVTPDSAPATHLPLQTQLANAGLELGVISSGLWGAVGATRDPIAEALAAFPHPAQRRSDTNFEISSEHEQILRDRAAVLGPGRKDTESLDDLGHYRVDAQIIEPGQLHKTVTEVWRALQGGQQAPIVVFASDRPIPKWAKEQEGIRVDAERLSSDRLMTIGGHGLAASSDFFYRAGQFDARADAGKDNQDYIQERNNRAVEELPDTEYDMTERFLGGLLDTVGDIELPIGYDPKTGEILTDKTGQVRRLGNVSGRELLLVHKQKDEDGEALDTTDTILLMSDIASLVTGVPETVSAYWTSATYKPSRVMSGIRASIKAAQAGNKRSIVVPAYGYADLSKIKGDQNPTPPSIQNIAGEMGKAAQEASDLRDFLGQITNQ